MILTSDHLTTYPSEGCPRADHVLFEPFLYNALPPPGWDTESRGRQPAGAPCAWQSSEAISSYCTQNSVSEIDLGVGVQSLYLASALQRYPGETEPQGTGPDKRVTRLMAFGNFCLPLPSSSFLLPGITSWMNFDTPQSSSQVPGLIFITSEAAPSNHEQVQH